MAVTPELQGDAAGGGRAALRRAAWSSTSGSVDYIDSSGIELLFRLHGALAADGSELIVVAPPGSNAARLLGLVAMTDIGEVRPSLAEALDRCAGREAPLSRPRTLRGVQPELNIFGLTLQTFGLMLGIAFVVCGALTARYLKEIGKPVDWAYEFIFAAIVGGIVGSRLWWIAENWDEASDDLLGSLFSGSGLVFFGGAIGGAIVRAGLGRHRGWLEGRTFDMGAAPLAAGYAIGRIGCQLAGDGDYGIPWDGPWAMAYPNGTVPTDVPVHPTPVYETLVMGAVMRAAVALAAPLPPGTLFALWAVLAGAERFLVEFIRRNEEVVAGLTQPQLISIAMMLAGGAWIATHRGLAPAPPRRPQRPARAPPASARDRDNGAPNGRRHRPRPPGGLRGPRRPAADRRLRRGGARPRARHARLRRSPRTTCAPARGRSPARWPRTTTGPGEVVFASKALPCTPVLRLFAEEGLGCDVASGGELHLALHAGFAPGADLPARQREVARRAGDGRRGGRRDDRARQRRGGAAALRAARRPRNAARAAAGHARRRRGHARGDPHGPGRLEVRVRARRRAAR